MGSSRPIQLASMSTAPSHLAPMPMLAASAATKAEAETSDEKIRFIDLSHCKEVEPVEQITVEQLNERIKTRAKDSKMHIRIGNFSKRREIPQVKEITLDESNQMAGTQIKKWSNTHIQAPDVKSFPPISNSSSRSSSRHDTKAHGIEAQAEQAGLQRYSYRDWAFYLFFMYPPVTGIKPQLFTVPVANPNDLKEDRTLLELMQKIDSSHSYHPTAEEAQALTTAAGKNLLSPPMLNTCMRRTAPIHTSYHQEVKDQLFHTKRKIYVPGEGLDHREFKVRLEEHITDLYPQAELKFFRYYTELFRPFDFLRWSQTAFVFLDRLASTVTQDNDLENEKIITAALVKIVMLLLLARGWMPPWRMFEQKYGVVICEFSTEIINLFFEQGLRDPLLLIESNPDVQLQLRQKNPWAYILALENKLQFIENPQQKACLIQLIEYAKNKPITQEVMQLGIDTHLTKMCNNGTDPGNLWLVSQPNRDPEAIGTIQAISASSVALQGLFGSANAATSMTTATVDDSILFPAAHTARLSH